MFFCVKKKETKYEKLDFVSTVSISFTVGETSNGRHIIGIDKFPNSFDHVKSLTTVRFYEAKRIKRKINYKNTKTIKNQDKKPRKGAQGRTHKGKNKEQVQRGI